MAAVFPARARLLEFSVAAAVVAILAAYLLDALARIEEEAEKTVVEATVRNMDSGLRLVQAQLMTQQMDNRRIELMQNNPVDWLERPPPDYAGSVEAIDPRHLARGQWVWDRGARTLYYRPRRDDGLRVAEGGAWLAWQVVAPGGPVLAGNAVGILRIEAVRAYEWRP